MKPFKRRRRGGLCATFEPGEAQVIASLTSQVVELLRDRNGELASDPDPLAGELGLSGGPSLPPEDPVLQRLLPDAYRDDSDESAEFRRFTERSLTSTKVANAEAVLASLREAGLDETVISEDDAEDLEPWRSSSTPTPSRPGSAPSPTSGCRSRCGSASMPTRTRCCCTSRRTRRSSR